MKLGKLTISACHGLVNIHMYTYLQNSLKPLHKNFLNKKGFKKFVLILFSVLKGSVRENERGYRLNAIKKRF